MVFESFEAASPGYGFPDYPRVCSRCQRQVVGKTSSNISRQFHQFKVYTLIHPLKLNSDDDIDDCYPLLYLYKI